MVEVRASGGKTYYFRYQDQRGRTRQFRLGRSEDIELSRARKLVEAKRRQIVFGIDPAEEKSQLRKTPTFASFIEEQYLPFVKTYKRSWTTDVSVLKNHLLPRFGKQYLDEIQRQDILRMHNEATASGAAAGSVNRLIIMMRFIYNLALRWEVPGVKANPSKGVPLLKENNRRDRYLSVDETRRLYEAVCESENSMLKHIVPMLILTGARKREVLDAQWQDFDLERRQWKIPMSKSGSARHVPLSDGALAVLREVPQVAGCSYTFANPKTRLPYASIFRSWDNARKRAGLAEVRIHDLRHSFASLLINQGRSLYEVQRLLGHTQVKTTQRYAHLANETLLAAANAATDAVGSVMLPKLRTIDLPVEDGFGEDLTQMLAAIETVQAKGRTMGEHMELGKAGSGN
jgi:integrase